MTTTTSYGTWTTKVSSYESSPEDGIHAFLNGNDPDEYDMDSIFRAYREAIDAVLPPGVSLCGNEFIGPSEPAAGEFDGYPMTEFGDLDFHTIIEDADIDLGDLFERYELFNLEHIGRWVLESKAKEPAKAAAAMVSKLGIKPFNYRPHPESGRPQAWYVSGEVRDALAARPGRGARTDLQG
ncbi:hypothetical protein J7E97_08305 [Streptomyces sp. ISL-66]|uniref:hypothetical protein n=1 Tax=Streptomyces sp. ISL-66 TaxID=2819186 RepID=UPI001BE98171|nr:hypothetical protein [Streptomyces sp. ISL-66]MBT2467876.1 hypothetical protein [Streptomyces sp. ISL-66]